jgi:acetyl-CoA acetyltransferase
MTTLVNALGQRGGRYGLQTMCAGGGMANAKHRAVGLGAFSKG